MKPWALLFSATMLTLAFGCADEPFAPATDDHSRWIWREAYPGEDLLGIGSGPLGFVAGGRHATGNVSGDGVTWSVMTYGGRDNLQDGVGVDDGWVAVGTRGYVGLYREHVGGTVFVAPEFDLAAVANSGPMLVAVGTRRTGPGGGLFYSSDLGGNWTASMSLSDPLFDVQWDGGRFVASGGNGLVVESADAVTWQSHRVPTAQSIVALARGDRRYLALGDRGGVFQSTNLEWWAQIASLPGEPTALAYSGGTYVAVGKAGAIWISKNAEDWHPVPSRVSTDLNGVAEHDGAFTAVGNAGVVLRSPDGRTWHREFGGLPAWFSDVRWTGTHLVLVDWTGEVLSSPDGIHWVRQELQYGGILEDIVEYPGGFLIPNVGGGKTWLSTDGTSWEEHASNYSANSISDAVWFQDRFIAVGIDGIVMTSTDGVTWSPIRPFTRKSLHGIAAGAGKLVAGDEDGTIYVSENADTWTIVGTPGTGFVYDLEWTESWGFLGISHGLLIHSENGLAWTAHPIPGMVIYGYFPAENRIYVVGYRGKLASSTDLVEWVEEATGTTHSLQAGVASPLGLFVAGDNGLLLTAP